MSAFKVGDICIGQHFVIDVEFNGVECEIVRGLQPAFTRNPGGVLEIVPCYLVRWCTGEGPDAIRPHNLRKKQPPRREIDTPVSWEDCAWSPRTAPVIQTVEKEEVAA